MNNNITFAANSNPFDSIRHFDENGIEYWLARELMKLLGYQKWERFGAKEPKTANNSNPDKMQVSAVCRAIISCNSAGNVVSEHFTHFPSEGTGFSAIPEDWKLLRFACYLVAMNGDVTKPQIAAAQTYFVVKARQAEVEDQLKVVPVEKEIYLTDLTDNDLGAAYADVYDAVAKKFGQIAKISDVPNQADIAKCLFWASHFEMSDPPEFDDDLEESTPEVDLDTKKFAVLKRNARFAIDPIGTAKWVVDLAKDDPDSVYLETFDRSEKIAGLQSGSIDDDEIDRLN